MILITNLLRETLRGFFIFYKKYYIIYIESKKGMIFVVAPSFQNFIKVSEPYKENGRMYISVQNPVTNKVRKVRWYSEDEYRRAYPSQPAPTAKDGGLMANQNIALGFKEGYVHLFKGDINEDNVEWFQLNKEVCFNVFFGWFLPSTEQCPEGIPEGIEMVKLEWDAISNGADRLGPEAKVKEVVAGLLYPPSASEYCGEIGQRLELTLTVKDKKVKETDYGIQNTHIFEDEVGNIFGWATTAKSLEVGETYTLRGTVKSHDSFRNIKTTWLTRCTIQ